MPAQGVHFLHGKVENVDVNFRSGGDVELKAAGAVVVQRGIGIGVGIDRRICALPGAHKAAENRPIIPVVSGGPQPVRGTHPQAVKRRAGRGSGHGVKGAGVKPFPALAVAHRGEQQPGLPLVNGFINPFLGGGVHRGVVKRHVTHKSAVGKLIHQVKGPAQPAISGFADRVELRLPGGADGGSPDAVIVRIVEQADDKVAGNRLVLIGMGEALPTLPGVGGFADARGRADPNRAAGIHQSGKSPVIEVIERAEGQAVGGNHLPGLPAVQGAAHPAAKAADPELVAAAHGDVVSDVLHPGGGGALAVGGIVAGVYRLGNEFPLRAARL